MATCSHAGPMYVVEPLPHGKGDHLLRQGTSHSHLLLSTGSIVSRPFVLGLHGWCPKFKPPGRGDAMLAIAVGIAHRRGTTEAVADPEKITSGGINFDWGALLL
jgi:hypothetical protein